MPAIQEFDKFFLTFPALHPENDFDRFWKSAAADMKKITVDADIKINNTRSSARFEVSDIHFKSIEKVSVHGILYLPRHTEKPKPVIIIHDYNKVDPYKGYGLDESMAYFFLHLRGHDALPHTVAIPNASGQKNIQVKTAQRKQEHVLPGYMAEGITEPENCYIKKVYSDALRSIDLLRLNRKLDCSSIGIIGKGVGAAAALYCAASSDRIKALVLDSPAFVHLDEWINHSSSDIAAEITDFIGSNPSRRNAVKRSLSYFDALNFSEKIECETLMSVGLKDTNSPAQCSFALFNHLLCEKTAEIYPDDGNEAGAEKQFKKTLIWIKNTLQRV